MFVTYFYTLLLVGLKKLFIHLGFAFKTLFQGQHNAPGRSSQGLPSCARGVGSLQVLSQGLGSWQNSNRGPGQKNCAIQQFRRFTPV